MARTRVQWAASPLSPTTTPTTFSTSSWAPAASGFCLWAAFVCCVIYALHGTAVCPDAPALHPLSTAETGQEKCQQLSGQQRRNVGNALI